MKLAFISSLNGGVGTFTLELVRELSHSVESIDLYLFDSAKETQCNKIALPKNVRIIMHEPGGFELMVKFLRYFYKFINYDLIHINYAFLSIPFIVTNKIRYIPYIITFHGTPQIELETGVKKFLYLIESKLIISAYNNSEKSITISEYTKKELNKDYNIECEVVYHGVNSKLFKPQKGNREIIRASLKILNSDFLILFVGSFSKTKNIMFLINIIPKIIVNNDNVRFLLIGEGELKNAINIRIRELNIDKYVSILSSIEREAINKYYQASDLLLFPSIRENFGLVLLESMACGLPVAALNAGASPEVIGDSGYLFNKTDEIDLIKKITTIISDKKVYEKLSERSLDRANKFSWEKAAESYLRIYNSILGNR